MSTSAARRHELAEKRAEVNALIKRARRIQRRSRDRIDWSSKANVKYNPLAGVGLNVARQNMVQLERLSKRLQGFTVRGLQTTSNGEIIDSVLVKRLRKVERNARRRIRYQEKQVMDWRPGQGGGKTIGELWKMKEDIGFFGLKTVKTKYVRDRKAFVKIIEGREKEHRNNVAGSDLDVILKILHRIPGSNGIVARLTALPAVKVAVLRRDTRFMNSIKDPYSNPWIGDLSDTEQILNQIETL